MDERVQSALRSRRARSFVIGNSDADEALRTFIDGKLIDTTPGADPQGPCDGAGVKDIKLFLQTYGAEGN